ncbi:MAG TPA: hypothetical protein VFM33_12915 [Aquabacterium sp.]|nr:hypothetical protein [Aquabacterium sp.]
MSNEQALRLLREIREQDFLSDNLRAKIDQVLALPTAAPGDEREAFEREMSKPPFEFDLSRWPEEAPAAWPGNYKQYHVQCAWDAWQARAALPPATLPLLSDDEMPPLPEGWPARFRCESCDGHGEVGDPISMGYFQPPECQQCPDCNGRGWASEGAAYSEDQLRARDRAVEAAVRKQMGVV